MIELDPSKLPAYVEIADADAGPNGPALLDRETVLAMAAKVGAGILVPFADSQVQRITTLEPEDFYLVFRGNLDSIRLRAKSSSLFDARALALHLTFQHFAEVERQPIDEPLAVEPLEVYLARAVSRLPERFTTEQRLLLADTVMMLTPEELADALRVDKGRLQSWRMNRQGPRFVKGVGARNAVRYAVADVAAWLETV